MEVSEKEISFLDSLIKLQEGSISTDIYFKLTDTHLYLNFKSCHPKHTKINITFCLASRVVTIVSDPEQQKIRLAKFLKRQAYPETNIDNDVERAKSKGSISGSQDRQKFEDSVIPLVSTYNPNNTNMIPFRSCEALLKRSSRMKLILNNYKILNSKRQAKNLKRLVTKSKFDSADEDPRVSKCGDKRCKVCPDLLEGKHIDLKNGQHFEVRRSMICTSSFVICMLICKSCGDIYIGKTTNMLWTRMTGKTN